MNATTKPEPAAALEASAARCWEIAAVLRAAQSAMRPDQMNQDDGLTAQHLVNAAARLSEAAAIAAFEAVETAARPARMAVVG